MLWDASSINGHDVEARDGTIGQVRDILFEDHCGLVKWLVLHAARRALGGLPVRIVGQPGMADTEAGIRDAQFLSYFGIGWITNDPN